MNKIIKSLISGFTALSMVIVSQGIIQVSADDPVQLPAPSIARTLSVKFMGRGDTPQDVSPGKAQLNADDKNNQTEFWVGVSVDKVHDLPLFTNGVYSLEVAFEYDPAFISPYYTSNDAEGDWKSALEKGNLSTENNTAWWSSDQYEIMSVVDTDIDIETDYGVAVDREAADAAQQRKDDGWRMCVVCVTFKGGSFDNTRFKGLTDEGEQCLIKLPFKVINVPADTASVKDPTVLSLVRGPETFNIGAGADGKSPHSTWEATVTDWSDAENMKTLFRDNGDISLFGKGSSIENIEPFKPKTGEETEDTQYILSNTDELGEDGFSEEQKTYYLRVPNETEKIKLKITSSDNPEVKIAYSDTAGETTINSASSGEKQFTTDEITLKEINKDTANGGTENGYNNTVTVSSGDTTYTIYIQRLLKPKIVLNPGNSPYGLIERMAAEYLPDDQKDQAWDEEKIKQAKEEFDKSDTSHGNLVYGNDFIPNNAITNVQYTERAWRSYDKNYDKDEYSIFVYEKSQFVDPGITVYNEFGEKEDNPKFDRELIVKKMSPGTPDYSATLEDIDLSIKNGDNSSVFSTVGNIIRPDKYTMKYSYTFIDEQGTNKTINMSRPVIILSKRGDIQLTTDPSFNTNDGKAFANTYSKWGGSSANSLFAFRVCDLHFTTDATVNTNDYKQLIADLGKYSKFPYNQYYVELPTN